LHYSVPSREQAACLSLLQAMPWRDGVHVHDSSAGTRADLAALMAEAATTPGTHVYACGPDAYMQAVMQAAQRAGLPESACHIEYFSPPEEPEYVNHAFVVQLARRQQSIPVAADQSLAEALQAHGVAVDLKCSDGICGVCQCTVLDGEVEHRDFVLSNAQRQTKLITCKSRAALAGATLVLDL
jgi:ferredoxin